MVDLLDQGRSKMAVGTFLVYGAGEYRVYDSEVYLYLCYIVDMDAMVVRMMRAGCNLW